MPYIKYNKLNVFYDTFGQGEPLLLLHGNSVSHKMFESEIDFYSESFRIIVFDYAGCGFSSRLSDFPDDYWNMNAKIAIEVLRELSVNKVNVIGTSGGGLVGLNLAILAPELVKKLIADSFLGEGISMQDAESIKMSRLKSKKNILNVKFWQDMNGDDWEQVVDNDINLLYRLGQKHINPIIGDLSDIKAKVLLTASTEDELIPSTDVKVKAVADKITGARLIVSEVGKHPFMITQKETFRMIAIDFLT